MSPSARRRRPLARPRAGHPGRRSGCEIDHGRWSSPRSPPHQHIESDGDARRGPAGQEGGREGLTRKPWVRPAGARLQGLRTTTSGPAHSLPEALASTSSATLHDPHRPNSGRSFRGGKRSGTRSIRRVGALRQPQLRGPIHPEVKKNYLSLRRWWARTRSQHHGIDQYPRASRQGPRRPGCVPEDVWPTASESRRWSTPRLGEVQTGYADVFAATHAEIPAHAAR